MTFHPLEFLPARYGDGSQVEEPTAADLALFANDQGTKDNLDELDPDTAQEHAITWGPYEHYYWAGYYESPMPPMPNENATTTSGPRAEEAREIA